MLVLGNIVHTLVLEDPSLIPRLCTWFMLIHTKTVASVMIWNTQTWWPWRGQSHILRHCPHSKPIQNARNAHWHEIYCTKNQKRGVQRDTAPTYLFLDFAKSRIKSSQATMISAYMVVLFHFWVNPNWSPTAIFIKKYNRKQHTHTYHHEESLHIFSFTGPNLIYLIESTNKIARIPALA